MLYTYKEKGHTHIFAENGLDGPIRALMHPSQLDLFTDEFDKRPIEVCSVSTITKWDKPESLPFSMAEVTSPHRFGGWRKLTKTELAALVVACLDTVDEFQQNELRLPVRNALKQHPLIQAGVTFAYGKRITISLVTLMQEIFDILRFIQPTSPNRQTRLRSYFGVMKPNIIRSLLNGRLPDNKLELMTTLIVQAWKVQPFGDLTREQAEADPQAFLFRLFFQRFNDYAKTQDDDTSKSYALWDVTTRYLLFIRQLWLAGIGLVPFEPERFFERKDEVDSFVEYTQPAKEQLDSLGEGI